MLLVALFSLAHAQILYACDTMQLDVSESCCCEDAEMASDLAAGCDSETMSDEPSSCCHVEVSVDLSPDEETEVQLNSQDLRIPPALVALAFTLLDFSRQAAPLVYSELVVLDSAQSLYLETSRLRI